MPSRSESDETVMSRIEIPLIDIGEGLAEAVVSRWLVKAGDQVEAMQPYVEVETDKVTTELPAPQSGRVVEICFKEGETVAVGACLIVIDTESASTPVSSAPAPSVPTPKASPAVRHLASELGVDLAAIKGTGDEGLITSQDVRNAAPDQSTSAAHTPSQADASRDSTYGTFPLSTVRRTIAEHMQSAWQQVPHITDLREIEVGKLKNKKSELAEHPSRPTYTAFFVAAVAHALRMHPRLNASLDWPKREVTFHQDIHVGIATYVDDDRLVVPVVRNADKLTIFEISEELRRFGELAKSKKLTHDDVSGATFNISSAGQMGGGWYGTPIVSPPQVAVMGFGPILDKVVAEHGNAVVRPVMPLMISVDHRLIDGRTMCVFGNEVERLLRECAW